jgi:hypothetical protein
MQKQGRSGFADIAKLEKWAHNNQNENWILGQLRS